MDGESDVFGHADLALFLDAQLALDVVDDVSGAGLVEEDP